VYRVGHHLEKDKDFGGMFKREEKTLGMNLEEKKKKGPLR